MNKYTELKAKHSKMINDFPMAFAFSKEQFEEAKEKLNVTSNDELLSIPSGGMIRKTDREAYYQLWKTHDTETREAMKDDEYLYQGFLYELGNHEFCITYNPEDTLACFGLEVTVLDDDERISRIFKEARTDYLDDCEGWN